MGHKQIIPADLKDQNHQAFHYLGDNLELCHTYYTGYSDPAIRSNDKLKLHKIDFFL